LIQRTLALTFRIGGADRSTRSAWAWLRTGH